MANIHTGGSQAGIANVDADYQLNVTTNADPTKAGSIRIFGENDSGTVTGSAYLLSPEVSDDYRLRIGVDTIQDQEIFNYTNQNTAKHSYLATNITGALSGGAVVTNSGSATTASSGVLFRTHRFFPTLLQQTSVYAEFNLSFTNTPVTNTTIDFGQFIASGTQPFAPTDGVYFRLAPAGLFGVYNYNGTETTTSVFSFTVTANRVYSFLISYTNREVKFWINDVLYGKRDIDTALPQPFMSANLPVALRHGIGGSAAGAIIQAKLWSYSLYCGDVQRVKDWKETSAGMGNVQQVQQGATTGGQLSTYALGAAPATLTLTASTAPATNTLGGLYALPVAVTTGESDYPLFAWQNPAGTVAIPGKTFFCTGVTIGEQWVSIAALTGGPLVSYFAVGFGSTASSLATTEQTTFVSNTTKIARKIPLGAQTLAATAPLGTIAAGFQRIFPETIPINQGEFLHIIVRFHGTSLTAGTAQVRGSIAIHGYFE